MGTLGKRETPRPAEEKLLKPGNGKFDLGQVEAFRWTSGELETDLGLAGGRPGDVVVRAKRVDEITRGWRVRGGEGTPRSVICP